MPQYMQVFSDDDDESGGFLSDVQEEGEEESTSHTEDDQGVMSSPNHSSSTNSSGRQQQQQQQQQQRSQPIRNYADYTSSDSSDVDTSDSSSGHGNTTTTTTTTDDDTSTGSQSHTGSSTTTSSSAPSGGLDASGLDEQDLGFYNTTTDDSDDDYSAHLEDVEKGGRMGRPAPDNRQAPPRDPSTDDFDYYATSMSSSKQTSSNNSTLGNKSSSGSLPSATKGTDTTVSPGLRKPSMVGRQHQQPPPKKKYSSNSNSSSTAQAEQALPVGTASPDRRPVANHEGLSGTSGSGSNKKQSEAPEDACLGKHETLKLLVILISLVVIGLGLGLLLGYLRPFEKKPEESKAPTPAPMAPTISPAPTLLVPTPAPTPYIPTNEELMALFRTTLAGDENDSESADLVDTAGTPQQLAADWILEDDPYTHEGDKFDIAYLSLEEYSQRFLLVSLYFETTRNGRSDFSTCGREDGDSTVCDWLVPTPPTEYDASATSTSRDLASLEFTTVPSHRWLSNRHECDWAGVTCGTIGGVDELGVIGLSLAAQSLSGTIPTHVLKLPTLRALELPYNDLAGTLPEDMASLRDLDLSHNFLEGSIPMPYGSSGSLLEMLSLESNQLTGELSESFFPFGSPLKRLNVAFNQLTGTVPATISLALNMHELSIMGNSFQGSLPAEIGQLPLTTLKASSNNFQGRLPMWNRVHTSWYETLEVLWLSDNRFTGSVPSTLGSDLRRVEELRLAENQLTGDIPTSLYEMNRLFVLDLAENQLTGTMNAAGMRQLSNLEVFDVHSNRLQGNLPAMLGSLVQLRNVKVEFNEFVGAMPDSLCEFSGDTLQVLSADCLASAAAVAPTACSCCTSCCNRQSQTCVANGGNDSTPQPPATPDLSFLRGWARETFGTTIDVSQGSPHDETIRWIVNNRDGVAFTADSPSFLQRYVLAVFYHKTSQVGRGWLSCNKPTSGDESCLYQQSVFNEDDELIGYDGVSRTRWLSSVSECSWAGVTCTTINGRSVVTRIQLPGQQLSGSLPREVAFLSNLQQLQLSHNDLTGTLPSEVTSMSQLSVLSIQDNQFNGSLPIALFTSLPTLRALELGENDWTAGPFPDLSSSNSGQRLQVLHIDHCQLTGTLPTTTTSVLLSQLQSLRLNGNNLQGSIPNGLTTSTSLRHLWLQENMLNGTIPAVWGGRFRSLEELRLDNNALTGSLPLTLYGLPELQRLEVHNNALIGSLSTSGSWPRLQILKLNGNSLVGTIPSTLFGSNNALRVAYFNGNLLRGSMPSEICALSPEFLQVDCDEVNCSCCTACCIPSGECSTPLPQRRDAGATIVV